MKKGMSKLRVHRDFNPRNNRTSHDLAYPAFVSGCFIPHLDQLRLNPAKSGLKNKNFSTPSQLPPFASVKFSPSVFIGVHTPRRSLTKTGPWLKIRRDIKITKRTHFQSQNKALFPSCPFATRRAYSCLKQNFSSRCRSFPCLQTKLRPQNFSFALLLSTHRLL